MKRSGILCILVCFVFLSYAPSVRAQQNNQLLKSHGCLKAKLCNDVDASLHKNLNCPSNIASDQGTWPHRTRIYSSDSAPLTPNTEVYVTECIDTNTTHGPGGVKGSGQGLICTTGSSRLDKKLFCGNENATEAICDHYTILQNQFHNYFLRPNPRAEGDYAIYYSKNNFTNYNDSNFNIQRPELEKSDTDESRKPVRTDSTGRLPLLEWQAYTGPETTRRYVAFEILAQAPTPTVTPIPTNSPGASLTPTPAGIGGQQQGTLPFATPTRFISSPSDGCSTVTFDPYGRVFDAISLEPIPNVEISLLQRDPISNIMSLAYAQSRNLAIVNPQQTYLDGGFSYLVEDGDYRLQPVIAGYSFSTQGKVELPKNTAKIYSDFYYSDSADILQRGKIQHRDIPLLPTDSVGKNYSLKIISQYQEGIVKDGLQIIRYSGRVSHPFAKTEVYICDPTVAGSEESCEMYKSIPLSLGGVDKYGNFNFELDQADIVSGKYYQIEFTKQKLNELSLTRDGGFKNFFGWLLHLISIKNVNAQEVGNNVKQKLEPIISYIEGFAYDANGDLLKNTQVDIYLPFSKISSFRTYTDGAGYYRITSENLPASNYRIAYTPKGRGSTTITTSQFLQQNKEFIASEKINPTQYWTITTNPRRSVTPSFVPPDKISPLPTFGTQEDSLPAKSDTSSPVSNQPIKNNLILVGAILLLVIATAGTLLGVYLYRKKKREAEI